ncbi:MAG: hypothetical protein A2252_08370 [Elusimicrobia bacterium RIFOXYA2_FULL_39_19]|nr:MAG: hypothetical protein A2252_08370 [Elusimicrobia bacterium RIFOXYA2_FULL_39_19]
MSIWLPLVLFHTIAIILFVFLSLKQLLNDELEPLNIISDKNKHLLVVVITPFLLLIGVFGLQYIQSQYFNNIGYLISVKALNAYFVISLFSFIIYNIYTIKFNRENVLLFLILLFSSYLIAKMLPIASFPITAKRSDLLPILKEAGRAILSGQNPYKYYLLDNGILTQNVRFPGLMISYIPAVYFNFDLRFITLFFESFIFLILAYLIIKFKAATKIFPYELLLVLIAFFLLPYWHFRHELYEAPFWMLLTVVIFALYRNFFWMSAIVLGLLISMHQWGILFAPYLAIYQYKTTNLKKTILMIFVSSIIAITVFLLIPGFNVKDFFEHTIVFYKKVINEKAFPPLGMFFTPYFSKLNLTGLLQPIQVLLQIPLLFMAYKHGKRIEVILGILAVSLLCFLLFNPVVWTYQYLLLVYLLILGLYFKILKKVI